MKRPISTWERIRVEKGISRKDFSKSVGCAVSSIWHFEKGDRPMPVRLQIEYLKLRNTEKDKIVIEYLKERMGE